MDRQMFIVAVAAGLVAFPFGTSAEQAVKMRRIGLLSLSSPLWSSTQPEPILEPLRALGWIEGRNLIVERRHTDGKAELLQPMAEELILLHVELIVAYGTVASLAAKSVTTNVPIVINRSGDPVRSGLVASFARPGGNITGNSTISPELGVKRLELLRQLLPGATRIGELVYPRNPVARVDRDAQEQAYRSLQMKPIRVEAVAADELESAVAELARLGAQALIVNAEPLFAQNFAAIVRAAHRFSLPIMVETTAWLEDGGLLSYGPSEVELDRQVAVFVDKILKGAKPADLPALQPTKFELGINLNAAKALGITVPKSLLLRADEVIQ